jgi:uncharacterized Ntn-hydrolase superfamily protein
MKQKLYFLRLSIVTILFLTTNLFAQHTFSIVAVDIETGEIGSAGATCISAEDGALAISDIVLGIGAIHTQAYWNATNQTNAHTRMLAGDSPQQVIDWLIANDISGSPSYRQYGVVDLNGGSPRSAAHTGSDAPNIKLHKTGDNYSIQGNILISEDVVNDMETAFLNTTGTLADKLMAALQGAKRPGADSRCLDYGISSASSFLRVAQPTDTDSSYGNLSIDINVWITSDVFEPIDALQNLYTQYLETNDNQIEEGDISLYPNPVVNTFMIQSDGSLIFGYDIIDAAGKLIQKRESVIPYTSILVDAHQFKRGVYFIRLYSKSKRITTKRILVK